MPRTRTPAERAEMEARRPAPRPVRDLDWSDVEADAQRGLDEETVKFPEIEVQLTGTDSNAMSIIGAVRKALRRAGVSSEEIQQFSTEATSGDYDNVLATAMRWVEVS